MLGPNSMPKQHMVVDPGCSMYLIPVEYLEQTTGSKSFATKSHPPSLCMLYQSGTCKAGKKCHQVHARKEYVERMRTMFKVRNNNCCYTHGDLFSKHGGPWHRPSVINLRPRTASISIPTDYLARTSFEIIGSMNGPSAVPLQKICCLHLQNDCHFGRRCRYVHICRVKWHEILAQYPELETEPELEKLFLRKSHSKLTASIDQQTINKGLHLSSVSTSSEGEGPNSSEALSQVRSRNNNLTPLPETSSSVDNCSSTPSTCPSENVDKEETKEYQHSANETNEYDKIVDDMFWATILYGSEPASSVTPQDFRPHTHSQNTQPDSPPSSLPATPRSQEISYDNRISKADFFAKLSELVEWNKQGVLNDTEFAMAKKTLFSLKLIETTP